MMVGMAPINKNTINVKELAIASCNQRNKVIISSAKRSYTRNDGQLSARAYSIVGRANKSSNCLSASGFQNFNLATKGTKLSAKRSYRKSAANLQEMMANWAHVHRRNSARETVSGEIRRGVVQLRTARLGNSTGEHKFCISDENVEKQKTRALEA